MSLDSLLISFGVNIASSFIYDVARKFFQEQQDSSLQDFKNELSKSLEIENAEIISDSIIEFLAKNGDINISGSKIFAKESIFLTSSSGTKFQIKDGSSSKTEHNSVDVGKGSITGKNGAEMKQSKEGISFST
ncbi:MAG: hypothetical protein K1060chlam5_00301 [Candidatus Anoxychlamydiales bacterium]|nr:hypothetical protein [Candidatus Anoxychlamydiales bacterium]